VSKNVLENCIRNELDVSAHRCFACLKPIKVTIANHKPVPPCNVPNHPANKDFGTRTMEFSPVVYIDSSDFRETDSKDFFGLAPGKTVRLLHGYDITCKEVKKSNGVVTGANDSGANCLPRRLFVSVLLIRCARLFSS
jgi:glutaminyl-tRNA synthetase